MWLFVWLSSTRRSLAGKKLACSSADPKWAGVVRMVEMEDTCSSMDVSLEHNENAVLPTRDREDGSLMAVNEAQPLNASHPIDVSDSGSAIDGRLRHPLNAE